MTSRYTLHEPFPTFNHVNSMSFGRGGAGNRTSNTIPSKNRSQLPPNTIDTTHAHPGPRFSTGRGGAGNMPRAGDERAMFHFDEELKSRAQHVAPVYHVGRGGQGNTVSDSRRRGSHGSSDSGKTDSSSSASKKGLDWVKGLTRK